MIYHDGANHYLYREIKESVSDEQLENILDKIYTGSCTKADISRYTKTYRHTYLWCLWILRRIWDEIQSK